MCVCASVLVCMSVCVFVLPECRWGQRREQIQKTDRVHERHTTERERCERCRTRTGIRVIGTAHYGAGKPGKFPACSGGGDIVEIAEDEERGGGRESEVGGEEAGQRLYLAESGQTESESERERERPRLLKVCRVHISLCLPVSFSLPVSCSLSLSLSPPLFLSPLSLSLSALSASSFALIARPSALLNPVILV